MSAKSQKKFVEQEINRKGYITRNEALKMYISRLGAIMCRLKEEGLQFTAYKADGDYVYTTIPNKKVKLVKWEK